MKTLFLGIAGALVGLVAWALCGLGMTELGLLARFDPVGIGTDLPDPSAMETIAEWSFPVCMVAGALVFPVFVRWSIRNPHQTEDAS